ncbi:MAG: glycerophosphodiester phosphodiesterase family protein [Desulfobacterales bacterium]|jgi:glycerophosphoryl diester phosphodiesterase
MKTRFWLEKIFYWIIDHWSARRRQPIPPPERLRDCKIVSHRGEHDNRSILENTLPAFDAVEGRGIWGLEFDVRWTRDLHPVVFHDRDTQRLFGIKSEICRLTISGLNTDFPLIPTLAEVIDRYGKKLHLMVEIKAEVYRRPVYQNQILADLFSPLEAGKDFHFLSMTPDMFDFINFIPAQAMLPVAGLNVRKMSALAIRKNYAGILTHYFILRDSMLCRHQRLGHHMGTGYIGSKNCLFRELNRNVDWLFSNKAGEIQSICNSVLKDNQR